ncbi:hypothetical protein BDV06DRAFT_87180 [Aspergillus oleicola]
MLSDAEIENFAESLEDTRESSQRNSHDFHQIDQFCLLLDSYRQLKKDYLVERELIGGNKVSQGSSVCLVSDL